MLKKHELDVREVNLGGETYTVSAMTVRQRSRFEALLARLGAETLREGLLIYCVTGPGGVTPFNPSDFRKRVDPDSENPEQDALDLLIDEMSTYPATQVQPLIEAAMEINGLMGNAASGGSAPS